MSKELCIICRNEAELINVTVDVWDIRCKNCGKYIFLDGLNEASYKNLSEEKRKIISNYIKEFNAITEKWAQFGDIDILWKMIEDFNRAVQKK
jgi:hypothetical protein